MIVRICNKCGARKDSLNSIKKSGGMTTTELGEICDFCLDRLKQMVHTKPTPTPTKDDHANSSNT